jgi:hypothetical protein
MDDETVQKIYKLASELASQQQSNQELALGLSNHLNEIKVWFIYYYIHLYTYIKIIAKSEC